MFTSARSTSWDGSGSQPTVAACGRSVRWQQGGPGVHWDVAGLAMTRETRLEWTLWVRTPLDLFAWEHIDLYFDTKHITDFMTEHTSMRADGTLDAGLESGFPVAGSCVSAPVSGTAFEGYT